MFPRSLINLVRYILHRKNHTACDFCAAIEDRTASVLSVHQTMVILKNAFPYSRWDGRQVRDHVLVVPRRHINQLADMTGDESSDFMDRIAAYEANGYSFYIRSHANKKRSVDHLHGHLLLLR
jgi:diadenosine tetraphosphate (Ap4A) HIT family hydrolase